MLNDRQRQAVIDNVNEDVNLPFISEEREERGIAKLVDKIMPQVEPALNKLMPTIYVTCIKIALNEEMPLKERRERISDIMRKELAAPLAVELNEHVDVSGIPEFMEGQVLRIVANKVIDNFVEWTLGKIEDKLT